MNGAIIELARQGFSDREIERRTGIERRRIARIRREHGIPAWQPPVPEHGTDARWQRGCPCEPCHTAHLAKKHAEHARRPAAGTPMPPARSEALTARASNLQAETRALADRARTAWTDEDLAIALDYRHTAAEAAILLGRTLSAVRHIRQKRRAKPDTLPHRPRKRE